MKKDNDEVISRIDLEHMLHNMHLKTYLVNAIDNNHQLSLNSPL